MAKTNSTMLPLGTEAIDFSLPNYNSRFKEKIDFFQDYSNSKNYKGYVLAFWCNHCPYVLFVEDRFIAIANEYLKKGICFLAINSNDVTTHPEDSPEKMIAQSKKYPFPYLYDKSQQIAKSYRAACTPDFFVFNKDKKLFYRGQIDDSRPENSFSNNDKNSNGEDLKFALDCLLKEKDYPSDIQQKASMGCNIKWKSGNEPDYF